MATPESRFRITARDRTDGAFRSVRGNLNRMDRGLGRVKAGIIGVVAGFVSFRAVLSSVEAFKRQEQAIASVNASIVSMGRETRGLSRDLQQLASQIQREGIIGDEAILEGVSFLTTFAKITDDLLPRTTRVLADLAVKFGGDTVRAANTLGKASEGLTGELTRVGISLSDSAKESKDFVQILSEIEQQVSGLNLALSETATGSLQQFKNALGDTQEVLGEIIAISISPFIKDMTERMLGFTASVDDNRAEFESWARLVFNGLVKVASGVNEVRARFEQMRAFWKVLEASYLDFVVEPILEGTIKIQRAIASIPKIGGRLVGEALAIREEELIAVQGRLDELQTEIVRSGDIVGRSREQFQAWVMTLQQSFDVALRRGRELRDMTREVGGAPGGGLTGDDQPDSKAEKERERELKRLTERFERIRAGLLTERELLIEHFEQRTEIIDEAFENDIVTQAERDLLRQELELVHQAKLGNIVAQGELKRRKFVEQSWQQQTKFVIGQAAAMTAGVAQHNRALFEINKIAGIANAVINTARGVTLALASYPPPISFVMAALQAAAGAAQISAIRSTSFGGGGTGAAPSIAGTTPAPAVTPVDQLPLDGESQRLRPQQLINITIVGDVFTRDQVLELMEEMSEAIGDGAELVPA